jgi:hypothetical protein
MAIAELADHQVGVLKQKKKRVSSKRESKRASRRTSTKASSSSKRKSTPAKAKPTASEAAEENAVLKAINDVWTQLASVDWKGHVDGIVKSFKQ